MEQLGQPLQGMCSRWTQEHVYQTEHRGILNFNICQGSDSQYAPKKVDSPMTYKCPEIDQSMGPVGPKLKIKICPWIIYE